MNRSQNFHNPQPLRSASQVRVQPSPETSRREILTIAALAAGGAAVVSALPAFGQTEKKAAPAKKEAAAPVSANTNDIGILNFALGLEYLEADFYSRAVSTDAQRQFLHGRLREVATTLRDQELAHVEAISAAIVKLGGAPVARGTYRYQTGTFQSPLVFAQHAAALEAIGVGAYLGAVSLIQNRDIRRAAAAIYGTETRHAAMIRHLSGNLFATRYYEGPLTPSQVTKLIDPYVS